jgi:hypothetical protein
MVKPFIFIFLKRKAYEKKKKKKKKNLLGIRIKNVKMMHQLTNRNGNKPCLEVEFDDQSPPINKSDNSFLETHRTKKVLLII